MRGVGELGGERSEGRKEELMSGWMRCRANLLPRGRIAPAGQVEEFLIMDVF